MTSKETREWHRRVRDLLLLVGIKVKLVEMREDWSGIDVEAAHSSEATSPEAVHLKGKLNGTSTSKERFACESGI